MKKKNYATIIIIIIVAFAGYSLYSVNKPIGLSALALVNVEALGYSESDGRCTKWVTKSCYNDFLNAHDPYVYYAKCYNNSVQIDGKSECGEVLSNMPMYPYSSQTCLECMQW